MSFKIGDKVIILMGNTINNSGFITSIKSSPDTFGNELVYLLDGSERLYYYENMLKLDIEWNRNEKINKLLDGISH